MNRLDQIDQKLDAILEKVSKIEVHVEVDGKEINEIKTSVKEHDTFINRVKGGIAFITFIGVTGLIRYLMVK